jgi:3-oxoacyl-[acyl-carrier protein] reductase
MTSDLADEDRQRIVRRRAQRPPAPPAPVAHAVEKILGDGAQNVTGTVLTVDAGSTA